MKTLVLVRHAHRDTDAPDADNGLSKKGHRQAEAVRRFYKERFGKEEALLLSSPRKRCVETLEPLAEKIDVPVKIDERLLEGGDVPGKTASFEAWWRDIAPALVVACSHGDWIPSFLDRAAGAGIPLKKGAWAELRMTEEGDVRLECLSQTLPEE